VFVRRSSGLKFGDPVTEFTLMKHCPVNATGNLLPK
jgi:hypothetical protein